MAKFAVLHLEKGAGNDAPISSHIERTVNPSNADKDRTHLNRELIQFPEGVKNRTEAIQYRIEHAGIIRKISHNQVRAIRVMMTGSPEQMQRIQSEGKLDDWCRGSLNWLRKEVGNENIVSAVLHLDEQTPHIHATIVPIVKGERRKAKQEQQKAEKKYKKKNVNTPRLCADDIMSKERFKQMQDTYAQAMSKFGLVRGKEGSDARHISTQQYYRELADKNEQLEKDNEVLQVQKEQTNQELSRIRSDIKTEELKNKVADVGSNIMDGIGSLVGTSKVKRQQQEIDNLKAEKEDMIREIKDLKRNMQAMQKEHESAMDKLKQELNKIHALFPKIKELLRMENLCRHLGFSESLTKAILEMKPVGFRGKLYSSEYQRYFETEHSVAEIKPSANEPDKLRMTIDGVGDTNWFRQKYREFQESIGIKVRQKPKIGKGQGF